MKVTSKRVMIRLKRQARLEQIATSIRKYGYTLTKLTDSPLQSSAEFDLAASTPDHCEKCDVFCNREQHVCLICVLRNKRTTCICPEKCNYVLAPKLNVPEDLPRAYQRRFFSPHSFCGAKSGGDADYEEQVLDGVV